MFIEVLVVKHELHLVEIDSDDELVAGRAASRYVAEDTLDSIECISYQKVHSIDLGVYDRDKTHTI